MEIPQRWYVSIAVFVLVTLIGVQLSLTIGRRAVAHLPGDDVSEALYRDEIATKYVLTGYCLTLATASLAAWLAFRRTAARTNEK